MSLDIPKEIFQKQDLAIPKPPAHTRAELETRSKELEDAGRLLKAEFIGLDSQIDTIINAMRPWYVLPETLQRPVVIGLWGRTGVGKTSLIQRLVEILKLQQNFAIQDLGKFSGADRYSSNEDLGMFERFSSFENRPAVFLLDEIQTVRTRGETAPIDRPNLRELWNFLDTGKLTRDLRAVEQTIFSWTDRLNSLKLTPPAPDRPVQPLDLGLGEWELDLIRRYLMIPKKVITQALSENPLKFLEDMIARLREQMTRMSVADFSRSLVFVAGNLDSMFGAIHVVDPDQIPADEMQSSAAETTLNDAKTALLGLFRPEEVARLGSIHVIFPGFTERQFGELIDLKLRQLSERLDKLLGIRLEYDASIRALVSAEGVIPAQGARPLIALIGEFIESQVPTWVLALRMSGVERAMFHLRYDRASGTLIAEERLPGIVGRRFESHPHVPQTLIRRKQDDPILRRIVAVHEAGHVVVGIAFLGMLPKRVYSSVAKPALGGHVEFAETPLVNSSFVKARLACLLAGAAAEQRVFGHDERTNGSQEDLRMGTRLISEAVSQWAMSDHLGQAGAEHPDNLITLKKKDDIQKERWLREAMDLARRALRRQEPLFRVIAEFLMTESSLPIVELSKMVLKHYRGADAIKRRIIERQKPIQYEAYDAAYRRFIQRRPRSR